MITDYATLQSAIGDWVARSDLAPVIPDFIRFAETRLSRDLKVRQMQVLVSGTATGLIIDLPSDMVGIQSLHVPFGGVSQELHPLPPARLIDQDLLYTPAGYVVIGQNAYIIGGTSGSDYTLLYQQKLPTLSATNTTNWLILDTPALYLYAALIEASPYIGDDQRAGLWVSSYQELVKQANAADERARYGNAPAIVWGGNAP